jgi:hypothetical protein
MFKPAALALGLLTVLMVVSGSRSSAKAATIIVPTDRVQSRIQGNLYAEKLIPIKQSTSLRKTAIEGTSAQSTNRQPVLSPEQQKSQRIKTACQQEYDDRNRFGSNERSVGIFDNSSNSKTVNNFIFNTSTYTGSCNFSGEF